MKSIFTVLALCLCVLPAAADNHRSNFRSNFRFRGNHRQQFVVVRQPFVQQVVVPNYAPVVQSVVGNADCPERIVLQNTAGYGGYGYGASQFIVRDNFRFVRNGFVRNAFRFVNPFRFSRFRR